MSGYEQREEMITSDTRAREEAAAKDRPDPHNQAAAKMLVDAFGVRGTKDAGPAMEQLHGQFRRASQGAQMVPNSAIRRTPPHPQERIPRSSAMFVMSRDWDPTEK